MDTEFYQLQTQSQLHSLEFGLWLQLSKRLTQHCKIFQVLQYLCKIIFQLVDSLVSYLEPNKQIKNIIN
ncbi:unnamed protein product [Paramecium sonneborni]|uniref:Uncharacterized protein n=1 Tax=Paramecium sonneborni TaxID=65129 RepID=A0A8S1MJ99_9CILI|nr:unnamed protein product [Paramecium sonneborni]